MDSRPTPDDPSFMAEAIRLAAQIPCRPWPNPPVGALVVADGRIVGRGAHRGAGTAHAEVVALDEAGRQSRGATLYCTLEPCNHRGRTPPCAPRIVESGITRVVVGVADPNPRVCGGGLHVLRRAGIEVLTGVGGSEALELIWPFVVTRAFERPFVLLKTATSIDGRFAPGATDGPAGPVYLTGPEARRDVHRLRRWCDEVLVGERTMQADHPALDGRLAPAEAGPLADPVPAYADTNLSLESGWPRRAHRVYAGRDSAPPDRQRAVAGRGGDVVLCDEIDGRIAPESLVERFWRHGGHCLMVEGGPTLAASVLASGLVDRWVAYTAPIVLGTGVGWPERADEGRQGLGPGRDEASGRFNVTRCDRIGADVRTIFDRACFAAALAGPWGDPRRA